MAAIHPETDFPVVRTASLTSLFITPIAGPMASILTVAALALPTGILSLDHAIPAGACCTTYYPFVLLAAALLRPIFATVTAIGSIGLADALFMGPRYQLLETPMDGFGAIASMVSFGLLLGLVWLLRRMIVAQRSRSAASSASGVIFSLEQGVALANLPGAPSPIALGPEGEVAEMMQDFLAQIEVGKRLTQRADRYAASRNCPTRLGAVTGRVKSREDI